MEEVIYIEGIKEAAPVVWNGSYADEGNCQSFWLPVTVMSSHVNLSAIDHSEMASDINRFPGCLLALCAKALSNAYINVENIDFHTKMLINLLESQERLVKSTSSAFFLKKLEHLQICKCSKLTSIKERALKAQYFPMQRYRLFSLLQHLFYDCSIFQEKEHLHLCKCSTSLSLEERTLKAQLYRVQKYGNILNMTI